MAAATSGNDQKSSGQQQPVEFPKFLTKRKKQEGKNAASDQSISTNIGTQDTTDCTADRNEITLVNLIQIGKEYNAKQYQSLLEIKKKTAIVVKSMRDRMENGTAVYLSFMKQMELEVERQYTALNEEFVMGLVNIREMEHEILCCVQKLEEMRKMIDTMQETHYNKMEHQ